MNIIFYLQEDYTNTTRMILNRSSGSEAGLLIVILRLWRVQKIVKSIVEEAKSYLINQLVMLEREKNLNDHKIELLVIRMEDYEHENAYLKDKYKQAERDRNDLMNQLKSCAVIINNTNMSQKETSYTATLPGRHFGNHSGSSSGHSSTMRVVKDKLIGLNPHSRKLSETLMEKLRSIESTSSSNLSAVKCQYEDENDQNVYSNLDPRPDDESQMTSSDDETIVDLPVVRSVPVTKSKDMVKQVTALIEPPNISTFKPEKSSVNQSRVVTSHNQPKTVPTVNTFAQILAGRITSDVQNVISAKLVAPSSSFVSSSSRSPSSFRSRNFDKMGQDSSGSTERKERGEKEMERGMREMGELIHAKRPQVTARKSLTSGKQGIDRERRIDKSNNRNGIGEFGSGCFRIIVPVC